MMTHDSSVPASGDSRLQNPALPRGTEELFELRAILHRAAALSPQKGVHYLDEEGQETFHSYPALLSRAQHLLAGLQLDGMRAGDRLLFQLPRGEDFIPSFWACILGGMVPVPLAAPREYQENQAELLKLKNAWELLGKPRILSSNHAAKTLLQATFSSAEAPLILSLEDLSDAPPSSYREHDGKAEDLALLLLTSGSTGTPKAVMQSHEALIARSAAVCQMHRFDPETRSLNWMPLDHVGGLVMFHLRDVFSASEQWQVETNYILRSPLRWLNLLSQHRITATWAPNFAYALVNEDCFEGQGWDLSALRFILNGGEAIVEQTARRFLEKLAPFRLRPEAMHPAWGMSETCSGVVYNEEFSLNSPTGKARFTSVGHPVPGVSIRIVDSHNEVVPKGVEGRLQIQGKPVTTGYYGRDELNRTLFTPEGWFTTGDLGFIDSRGLTITGRENDSIIMNGQNFYSHELEASVEALHLVAPSYVAACALRAPGADTDQLALFFALKPGETRRLSEIKGALQAALQAQSGLVPDHLVCLPTSAFPKTSIGKIQRSVLATEFQAGRLLETLPPEDLPHWFYKRTWQAEPAPDRQALGGCVVVFHQDDALCEALASQDPHTSFISVHLGSSYAQKTGGHYVLNPTRLEDFQRLWEELKPAEVRGIIYAWTSPANRQDDLPLDLYEELNLPLYSFLYALQTFVAVQPETRVARLLYLSTQSQTLAPTDHLYMASAPAIGLVKTISQEYQFLSATHLDHDKAPPRTLAASLLAELSGTQSEILTYRAGQRSAARLTSLPPVHNEPSALVQSGFYLLSGGLGGIGYTVAQYLLQTYGAQLLLLGRRDLEGEARCRFEQLRSLHRGRVHYEQIPLDQTAEITALVRRYREQFGTSLAGIFHLAGRYREQMLAAETPETLRETLEPKIDGALTFHAVMQENPEALMVHFSSLISAFGSLSTGSYAAANTFLDQIATYQRTVLGWKSYSLLWSSWTDTGMSQGATSDQSLSTRGYRTISLSEGLASLEYALTQDDPYLMVGLDGTHPVLRAELSRAERTKVEETLSPIPAAQITAPRTPVEKTLVSLWEELLGKSGIGVHDNFFELGGRSLLAAKMFGMIHEKLGKHLPIPALFNAPTIAELAVLLGEQNQTKAALVRQHQLTASTGEAGLYFLPPIGSEGQQYAPLAAEVEKQLALGLGLGLGLGLATLQHPALLEDPALMDALEVPRLARELAAELPPTLHHPHRVLVADASSSFLALELAKQADLPHLFLLNPLGPVESKTAPSGGMLAFLKRQNSGQKALKKALKDTQRLYRDYHPQPASLALHIWHTSEPFWDHHLTPWESLSTHQVVRHALPGRASDLLSDPEALTMLASSLSQTLRDLSS